MSDVSSVLEQVLMVAALAVAIVLIGAGLVGYDFLGNRNVAIIEQPAWVTPPVWSEIGFGVAALAYATYAFMTQRKSGN